MRILDIINPYELLKEKEELDEALLSTDFKIGFELEAIQLPIDEEVADEGVLPGYHTDTEPAGGAKVVRDRIDKLLDLGETGVIEHDGSLNISVKRSVLDRFDVDGSEVWAFEYNSPIIPVSPLNIKKIKNMLNSLEGIGITTNDSCGFHVHISYPDISKADLAWIEFCIANDEELRKKLLYLNYYDYPNESDENSKNIRTIKFWSDTYSNQDVLNALKLYDKDGMTDTTIYTTSDEGKYLVFRIHPQGTLEWRGPRNFLHDATSEKGKAIAISTFLTTLYNFLLSISKILDSKEWNGFSREEILEKIRVKGPFNTSKIENAERHFEDLKEEIYSGELSYSLYRQLSKISRMLDGGLNGDFREEFLSAFTVSNQFQYFLRELNTNQLKYVVKDIGVDYIKRMAEKNYDFNYYTLDSVISSILLENIKDNNYELIKRCILDMVILTLDTPEELEKIFNMSVKVKGVSSDKKTRYQNLLLKHNSTLIKPSIFLSLIKNNNVSSLLYFNNIPSSIQRKVVKKSPWFIQYIHNPDPQIVKELVDKYGEEINSFVLGV